MATINMSVNVDKDNQIQAMRVFEQLGMDMSTAVDMFLRQAVLRQNIPFSANDGTEKDERKLPKPGCMKGKIWMADDFDAPLDDFKEYM